MKVLKYTPLVALKQRALGALVDEAAKLLADALKEEGEEIPVEIIRRDLMEFCILSARIEFEAADKADFDLAKAADTSEALTIKYLGYLRSEQSKLIQAAWEQVYQMDADIPNDPATAPKPPGDEDPKS